MFSHAQAPCRIGIAGGGTDLPAWTKEREGRCLSLAIATYTHAVAITRPDGQVVASYSHLDRAASATEIANGLIRESALMHGFEDGFEVHTLSEVPSWGSGLGISSSIAVCLAAVFARMAMAHRQQTSSDARQATGFIDEVSRETIARDAWTVEIDKLRRPIGRQDHMAAAFGGLRLYAFAGGTAHVERTFSEEDAKWVAEHLCLLRLSEGHDSRLILSRAKTAEHFQVAFDAVPVAIQAIEKRSVSLLGDALHMGQVSKIGIPGAVPDWLDTLVERVRKIPGVRGCKVTGAGGGGHLVVARDAGVDLGEMGLSTLAVVPAMRGVRSEQWA